MQTIIADIFKDLIKSFRLKLFYFLMGICTFFESYCQVIKYQGYDFIPNNVDAHTLKLNGKKVLRIVKDSSIKEPDEATFLKLQDVSFHNAIIEVKVLSRLLASAPANARGFIGLAFRIREDHGRFESVYLRPSNARAEDQVRRNHSVQYFSYPEFKFDRLRKENPEKYESYADMGLNEWIKMKIVLKGSQALLFLNKSKQPVLIVNDLKLGPMATGGLGFFVDIGTEAFFSDLKITVLD
jgi:hypothetical protein